MSLLQFLRILAARKSILLAALLGATIIATIMSQILPPRYEARARIMLDVVKPDPVTGQIMATAFLRAYTRTQIELIKDYQIAGQVVDKIGWANDPGLVESFRRSNGDNTSPEDLRRWLAQQIIDTTNADLIEGSNILEIKYSSTSQESSKRVVEILRQVYIDSSLDYKRESAGKTADWYREQTEKAKALLLASEAERSKFAKDNGLVLASNNADLETACLEAMSAQEVGASTAPIVTQSAAPAPIINTPASAQLDTINQQIAQASRTIGPNHPLFQALQRQRSVIESEAARQRAASMSFGQPQIIVQGGRAESAYQAQRARVLAQRDSIDKLNQISRDIEVKRDQYLKAAQRSADLRLEADVGEVGLTPMGGAISPKTPSFPNVPLIMGGSIGFGSALGICLALLIELMGRRIRSDEDLEHAAKVPVFAVIGLPSNNSAWYRAVAHWFGQKLSRRKPTLAEV
jgi:polysaccharide biosynthesis transport protein